MRPTSALCLLPFLAVVVACPPGAHAQTGAMQPLRIVVPIPAGGTSDVIARLIGERLRSDLGRPVIVDNRPGATGRIAVDALKSATPDGSTILLAPIAVPIIVPLVFKDAHFDPVRDLAPVAQVSTYEFALAVAMDHPARNLREFVAWAKTNRARATYGTPALGSIPHLVGAMLANDANVELLHVPYKGVAALETDLLGGRVAAAISALSDLVELDRAGKLRILATSGGQRSRALPEVPTFRQQGFESVEATGWHALYAPAKTPQPVIDQLSLAVVAALRTPEVRARMTALGVEPTGSTPKALSQIMDADSSYWRGIIKSTHFSAE